MPHTRKIAVVHDFLYCYAGAERVLEQILEVFPHADLFSLIDFLPAEQRGFIKNKPVTTSFIQHLPLARRKHRAYLPLMPIAIEQLDVSEYDIVISSSYLAAKGVITRPDQLHICYCHSPIRFAWDLQHQYLRQSDLGWGPKALLVRAILHYIRSWDSHSSNGVDIFVTNSNFVGRRVRKNYRRESTTLYPPVDIDAFAAQQKKEDFYLTASRLVPYKRVDLIVEAFAQMPHRQLVVIGEGPDYKKIAAKATPNVRILGFQPAAELRHYMQRAKAFVFAAEEDFGIVPVEAMACGTPVISFNRGGVTESVTEGISGVFFNEQEPQSLIAAVDRFESSEHPWDASAIRAASERFSAPRFRHEFRQLVEREWAAFNAEKLIESIPVRGAKIMGAKVGAIAAESEPFPDDEVPAVTAAARSPRLPVASGKP